MYTGTVYWEYRVDVSHNGGTRPVYREYRVDVSHNGETSGSAKIPGIVRDSSGHTNLTIARNVTNTNIATTAVLGGPLLLCRVL